MAKNEIVNVITIKTEESQQTIKGLKKEIADLKKSLDTAVIGSDEFEKASKELAMAQAELKTVMADGKKTTDNMEGSYNHLVATMAELKKQWKATADEVKRNELGQQIDNINNQLKELDGTIGNNQRLVGSYAEEFKKALGESDDATIRTRTQLESVQKVTAGLANGYAAVQGAMTLLNIENENLQKAMVKVQSAMAIAQGVGGLKDLVEGLSRGKVAFQGALNGVKAFIGGLNGVKAAIIGTGIGALVVAVGLLIANWDKLTKMFENMTAQERAARAMRELNAEVSKLANQTAAEKIVKVKELSNAYSQLGDNLKAKKQFVTDYKDELAKMGIEMNNVNDADEIFITNTDAYITAIMARAKADAARKKATEDYQKALDEIVDAEKEVEEAKRGVLIAETNERNSTDAYYSTPYWAYEEQRVAGTAVAAAALQVSNAKDNLADAQKELKDLQTEADAAMQKLFEYANEQDKIANKLLSGGSSGKKGGGGGKSDAQKEAEERAKTQAKVLEEFRVAQLSEEEKLYYELEKKYQEYMELFKGDTEKQLMVVQWYTDEYTKLVEKELDERIKADEQIAKSAEETRQRIAEADKQRYADAVAESEQRLDRKMQGIDSGAETAMYLNERQKPEGNGEINAIDNELSKLETLKNITNEQMNLKVAAIEAEQALFEESSARWIELENQKVALREQTNRTLLELEDQLKQQTDAKQRALAGSITKTFTAAMQSASAIIGALQEGIDTTTKEGFERNKKMQIAQATIQMLVGITSALAGAYTTKSGPWDWVLAGIQAATIGATGAIQIANIKKQTFDGGGSGSVSASVSPSMGFADVPVSYTRNLMGDKETENLNQEQRVYILESDIEESGRRVEVRDSNTNF